MAGRKSSLNVLEKIDLSLAHRQRKPIFFHNK